MSEAKAFPHGRNSGRRSSVTTESDATSIRAVGLRVRLLRTARQLTQDQLAELS